MTRRSLVTTLATGIAAVAAAPAVLRGRFRIFGQSPREYSERAIRLVGETAVIDLLNEFRFADYAEHPPKSDLWLRSPRTMTKTDYEPYRASGTRVLALGHLPGDYDGAVRFFADWNGFIAGNDEWFLRVADTGDIERARKSGKVGLLLTFQNSDHFRTTADVSTFFGLGQRLSQLTYNATNRIGSGFLAENDAGITPFGALIIAQMNMVGMAVDVSHCGDRTTLDALAAAKKPMLFSHASCRALVPDHMRCKTDEMIVKMANTGGVMGIPMLRFMIRRDEPVTIEHVLDHFDHVAKLVGVEHVAIGSDMDILGNPNPINVPQGIARPQDQPNFSRYRYHEDSEGRITIRGLDHPKRAYDLTEGLIRRGYSDAHIGLMLGGNWSRALGAIWPAT